MSGLCPDIISLLRGRGDDVKQRDLRLGTAAPCGTGRQSSRLTSAAGRAISRVALGAIAHVAAVSRTNAD